MNPVLYLAIVRSFFVPTAITAIIGGCVLTVMVFGCILRLFLCSMSTTAALKTLASYRLSNKISLILSQGSVLDFCGSSSKSAIVNAANSACLGGGGVDGAISDAGGPNLHKDRLNLPVINKSNGDRCAVGAAVMTGPGDYGSLNVPYVIHAVGPNFWEYEDDEGLEEAQRLLRSAYSTSLDVATEYELEEVAFALLSAGIFRGSCSLQEILDMAVSSICDWCKETESTTISKIHLCAFNEKECDILQSVCDEQLNPNKRKRESDKQNR